MKLFRNVSIAVALASVLSATNAGASQLATQYADMCADRGAGIPAPLGEGDLKDNPKLGEYCQCFGAKLAARVEGEPPSRDEMVEEEKAMRNDCRKQFDLPLLNF